MKKRIALLLAVVMTLSVIVPAQVFAATTNTLSKTVRTIDNGGVLWEDGVLGAPSKSGTLSDDSNYYYYDGLYLLVPLTGDLVVGSEIGIKLTNGEFAFTNSNDAGLTNTNGGKENYDINKGLWNASTYTRFARNTNPTSAIQATSHLYEVPYTLQVDDQDPTVAYIQIEALPSAAPYFKSTAPVAGSTSETAENNFLAEGWDGSRYLGNTTTGAWQIYLPLVTVNKEDDTDMTISMDNGNASVNVVRSMIYATSRSAGTKTTIDSVISSRDVFELDRLVISELKPQAIKDAPAFVYLQLPTGFHWVLPTAGKTGTNPIGSGNALPVMKAYVQRGLAWKAPNATASLYPLVIQPKNDGSLTLPDPNTQYAFYPYAQGYYNSQDKIQYNVAGTGSYGTTADDSIIAIGLQDYTRSTQLAGKFYITGLTFTADEGAPFGDISVIVQPNDEGYGITQETVKVATRADRGVGLKVISDTIPNLVSGRYIGPSWSGMKPGSNLTLAKDVDDNTHKTASVQLYENAAYSWWGQRTTVLALPATNNSTVKGAKFRLVKVRDNDNGTANVPASLYQVGEEFSNMYMSGLPTGTKLPAGYYLNDGEKHGSGGTIAVNDNQIILTSISVTANKKATIAFDLWVSLEFGFGAAYGNELKLSIDPSSTSIASKEDVDSVVIAHVYDPIKVSTKISDMKIGYQYQAASDIQITEIGPGYLLRGKTVDVSITDMISNDLYFTPTTTVAVTSGDLKITNIKTTNTNGFSTQSGSKLNSTVQGSDALKLSFDIEKASTTPSTITISNIGVKTSRDIPVTNQAPYRVVVYGTAVAENYGLTSTGGTDEFNRAWTGTRTWKADFNTPGVTADYINVVSSAPDETGILTQEVRVKIGESLYTVNGVSYPMDAAAYISAASHSTLVPLRFVANAFGIANDKIMWDDSNKTATIFAPGTTIQFTAGKTAMIVNGVTTNMLSPDNLPVTAEIKDSRMYIPFRALGYAFGVTVGWDAATQTAIYNEGANKSAAVVTPTPAQ